MKIIDYEIFGLERVKIKSGLPKSDNPESSYDRLKRLSNAPIASGHDCALKGIHVDFTVQADHSWWLQCLRYHFLDIVSSQSKMHCITTMKRKYHPFVCKFSKQLVEKMIELYNNLGNSDYESDVNEFFLYEFDQFRPITKQEWFEAIVMNCPIGLELQAEITTNYLQLKSVYSQRKNHKMSGWKLFCEWIKSLPLSELMIEHK